MIIINNNNRQQNLHILYLICLWQRGKVWEKEGMYYGTYLRIPGTDDFSSAEFIGESDHEASEGFVAVEASIVSSYPPIVRRRRSSRFRFRFRGEESRNLTLFGRGSCHQSQGAEAVDAAAVTQKDKDVVSSPLATSSCHSIVYNLFFSYSIRARETLLPSTLDSISRGVNWAARQEKYPGRGHSPFTALTG